ncbi:Alpha-acetolactate decarboxylase [Selenomonas ruminantium]|uniref:Alpha-acetolactate decarboxylase n=2 Tax=Selenomonas ruminantium TaxID=971 RepID=A0A1M6VHK7_SELRU|nr:Alpha-acetolactate decarboxylase [Selenomonas ruminantium]
MIVLDGKCYRARNNGDVTHAEDERGVPFASVCHFHPHRFEECEKMDTINAAGWHMHFLSEDEKNGGHVFDISLTSGNASFCKITSLEIRIPNSLAFDTYELKSASKEEIKSVEQGKNA